MKKYNIFSLRYAFFLMSLCSVIALIISFNSGNILAYNDATAHLNTTRRIFDSLTPGLVQIGSVWLPLLHILMLPFVLNDFLWQSGLAGSIVSMISFLIGGIFLYKLVKIFSKNDYVPFLSVVVYTFNLNFLYMQTTAMFEPLLIAVALGAIYFLTLWSKTDNLKYLIISAFFIMLASLTRYDGWALFIMCSIYILIRSITLKKKGFEGLFVLFISLAGFGIILWLLYNAMIFSDPLYFVRGEFSAATQQMILAKEGTLPTKGNMILSSQVYSVTTILNVGLIIAVTTFIGIIVFIKNNYKKLSEITPLLLVVPFIFNIFSLYLGQSVMWLPFLPPYLDTYFNARYGILMLPTAAFFCSYLALKFKGFKILIPILVLLQTILFLNPLLIKTNLTDQGIITLKDTVSSVNVSTTNASQFIKEKYNGGLILVSSASEDAFIFRAGIHLSNFITEGNGRYWKESLIYPDKYATWIVMFVNKSDRVGHAIESSSYVLDDKFQKVYTDNTYEIWQKKYIKN